MEESWQQIESMLDVLFDLQPDAQAAYLDEHCTDPELRRKIEALLKADQDAPGFLDEDAARFVSPLLETENLTTVSGRAVGPYTLIRELGRGGMGVVYLAERQDLERRVALKVVKGGLADPSSVDRFLQERRLLARLEHPHIARLYDVGITEDGTPYFAMELVERSSLIEYCNENKLDIRARLSLFISVCEAVQYAHQNFIVHRDLKPSNILVMDGGSEGPVPKLLDFGIAKVLAESEEEFKVDETETAFRRFTPAYAAPEQIKGEAITTATDVYSLGVVLYELLTGERPYDVDTNSLEAAQVVVSRIPRRPSTAITRTAEKDGHAEARRASASQLSNQLKGDLDLICLKALEKEPARRYASAASLMEDISRHLQGMPISARPATAGYRLQKFVSRHRKGVLASAVFGIVLISLVGFYTARLQDERDIARREARTAEQVASFMAGLFNASNPWEEVKGDTLRAGDLLERGAERLKTELVNEPEVRARMLQTVGQIFDQLGRYDRARDLVGQALEIRKTRWGDNHPEVAESYRMLGSIANRQGNYLEADSLAWIALNIDQRVTGMERLSTAEDLDVLALSKAGLGLYQIADSLHQKELAIRMREGDTDSRIALTLKYLASTKSKMGDFSAAESLAVEALNRYRVELPPEHPSVAEAVNDLAVYNRQLGRMDQAEFYYRQALDIKRKVLDADHPSIAVTLNNLGILLGMQGRFDETKLQFEEALEIRRARFGNNHPDVVASLRNLATLAQRQGNQIEAERRAMEVLAVESKIFPEGHPDMSVTYALLGNIQMEQERYVDAEKSFRRAFEMRRRYLDEDHESIGLDLQNIGSALLEQRRYTEAEDYLKRGLAIRSAALGDDHPNLAPTLRNIGRLYGETNRFEEGESLLLRAFQTQSESLRPGHISLRLTQRDLVNFYTAWGKPEEASRYRVEGSD